MKNIENVVMRRGVYIVCDLEEKPGLGIPALDMSLKELNESKKIHGNDLVRVLDSNVSLGVTFYYRMEDSLNVVDRANYELWKEAAIYAKNVGATHASLMRNGEFSRPTVIGISSIEGLGYVVVGKATLYRSKK